MKIAEALMLRSDCQKKIEQLRQRLNRSARVQEGEQPPENPQSLLAELESSFSELTRLVQRINKTNTSTPLNDGTLSDALAQRDTLKLKCGALNSLIQSAAIVSTRYSQSEVKLVSTVDIAALQRQVDSVAREHRLLDAQIQQLNWEVELLNA